MFRRIIVYFLLPFVMFAATLAVRGVSQMPTGKEMYSLLKSVNSLYENWNLNIPDIPFIPKLNKLTSPSGFGYILQALIFLVNVIVTVFNGLIRVINFITDAINLVVGLFQFFLTFLYYCRDYLFSFTPARVII